MKNKLIALLFASVLTVAVPAVLLQTASAEEDKMAKLDRWEGTVIRSSADKSTLTVRNNDGAEMTVQYDGSTRFVSQEHGSKTVNEIDASQIKDNDRVICKGTWQGKTLHATLISKRLSH